MFDLWLFLQTFAVQVCGHSVRYWEFKGYKLSLGCIKYVLGLLKIEPQFQHVTILSWNRRNTELLLDLSKSKLMCGTYLCRVKIYWVTETFWYKKCAFLSRVKKNSRDDLWNEFIGTIFISLSDDAVRHGTHNLQHSEQMLDANASFEISCSK